MTFPSLGTGPEFIFILFVLLCFQEEDDPSFGGVRGLSAYFLLRNVSVQPPLGVSTAGSGESRREEEVLLYSIQRECGHLIDGASRWPVQLRND